MSAKDHLLLNLSNLSNTELHQFFLEQPDPHIWIEKSSQVSELSQVLRMIAIALRTDKKKGAKLAGSVTSAWQPYSIELISKLRVSQFFKHQLLGLTYSDFAIPLLLEALSEKEDWGNRSAIRALAQISSKLSIVELIRLLAHPDDSIKAWAAWGLTQVDNPGVFTGLKIALNHGDECVRAWAIWALGEIPQERAFFLLIKALKHPDSEVRWRAAQALGKRQTQPAIPHLLQALKDPHHLVRCRAVSSLGQIGNPSVISELLTILKAVDDPESYLVALRAAEALGKIGGNEAIQGLIETLNHPDSDVRASVVSALGQLGTPEAVQALIMTLEDEDCIVRGRVAETLGLLGESTAISALLMALKDSDYYVRWRVVYALGKIGNERGIPGLIIALDDKISTVRQRAIKSLVEMGTPAAIEVLKTALHHRILEVRQLADEELQKRRSEVVDFESVFSTHHHLYPCPRLLITSEAKAREYLLDPTTFPFIEGMISIGSPGSNPPPGFSKIVKRLRLEFDDIETPLNDPDYDFPTREDIRKVIEFAPHTQNSLGYILIHCQAGISRSTAVALTLCTTILGPGSEQKAFNYLFKICPQARPNRWMIELADELLEREGKLVTLLKKRRLSGWM